MAQLVLSDTTNKQGILQQIEFYTGLGDAGITSNATLKAQMVGFVNNWYDRLCVDILTADGRFQWDDTNHGDLQIATTNLVSGQQDYSVTTDDNVRQIWKISRVDIKDSTGTWTTLKQIDQRDISGGFSAYESTNGQPKEFDWNGFSLFLFPKANYNSTGGIKIFFQREAKPFSATNDDSHAPGFVNAFHHLLALGPSYDYALANGKPNRDALRVELERGREELKAFYTARNNQEKPGLRIKQESTR